MIETPMLSLGKIISYKVRVFRRVFLADCRKRYVFVNVCITALPYGQKGWKKIDH